MSKVKECSVCGQGFDEENNPVGSRVPGPRCRGGQHEGLINRIAPRQRLFFPVFKPQAWEQGVNDRLGAGQAERVGFTASWT